MFGVLCILGFGISCSRVCVLGFLGSASSVLGLGCVGGQGVLKVCFLVFFAFVRRIVYHILYIQCSKQCQLCCMLVIMGNFIPFVLLWMKFLVDNFGQIRQLRRLQRLIFCLCSKRFHG